MKRIAIALAIMTATAAAQPGATPPTDPNQPPPGQGAPMPPQDPSRPYNGPYGEVQADAGIGINLDEIIARVATESPTLETIVRGTFRRARRAISIGPTVGVWGGLVPGQDDQEYAITFGIGLETFKVPIMPTPETLKQLVIERTKVVLKEQLKARAQGQPPDPLVAAQLAREIWEYAIKEVLGLQNLRPKTMERPAMNVALEVNRQLKLDGWTPRLRVGIGVWKFTLGASIGVLAGADGYAKTPVYTGLEVVTHFMMSDRPRASVFDVFLRADFELRNRDTNSDQMVLGVRYLLDVL